jgi:hypothetical protein
VQVRFRDSLGNINTADEGWIAMGTIVYYTPTYSPVTKWGADYSETANSITVTWTTPAGMTGVELSVNGGGAQQITGTGAKTHAITGVPKIDASGVRSGQSVTGVTGYTVTLTAYNAYSKAAPATVKIWNIPGMSVSWNAPVEEISTQAQLAAMARNDANKKYVLMNDITLTGTWTPVGTGDANAFKGKFYGNGHTISGVTPAGGVQHMGLFGYVKDAEIRDLCVEYTGAISPSSSYPYVGGIVGRAYGSTKILNCLSKGNLTINKSSSCSGSAVGGIAGALETGSVIIQNSYGGLNLTGNMTLIIDQTLRSIRVGGLAGYAGYGSSVKASTVRGNMDITSIREINAGGVAGYAEGSSLTASTVWGNLTVDNTGTGEVRAGGLAGYAGTGSSLTASTVRGNMDITASGQIYVGGVAGYVVGSDGSLASIEDCVYETGTIRGTTSTTSYTCYLGGIIGYVPRYAKVSNCYSRAGRITATVSTGNLHFGGFAGYMQNITVSDCGSSSPLALTGTPRGRVGGFAGEMEDKGAGVKLERCWATGDVNAQATGSFAAGGLVGEIYDDSPGDDNGDCKIINCYATGNVNVVSTNTSTAENAGAFVVGGLLGMALSAEISESWASGKVSAWRTTNGRIFAGGLVGSLGAYHTQEAQHDHLRSSISDCYALGDVLADNSYDGASSATQVYAGGLAGNVYIDSNNKIEHSFAAGSVTAQSFGTGATVYAGGVMGYKWTAAGALSNTAALGAAVTVAGGNSTRSAKRVYAYMSGGAGSRNFALKTMRTGTSAAYNGTPSFSTPTSSDDTSQHGKDASINDIRKADFWLDTAGLSFNYASGGLTGISNVWDFAGIAGRGYPLLANAGGQ